MNGDMKTNSFKRQRLNPKDLSNEELEFIIRTGKMPPSYSDKENQRPQSVQIQEKPLEQPQEM
jgi:hypothetical protein